MIRRDEYYEDGYCKISQNKGIIWIECKPGCYIDLQVAKSIVRNRLKISHYTTRPGVIDARYLNNITNEARRYFSEAEAMKFVNAFAIIISGTIHKLMGNAYIKYDRPSVPARLFTDEETAFNWVQNYR